MTEYTVDSFGIKRACLTEPTKTSVCTDCEDDCNTCSFKLAVEKLAAYEDTELEPHEISCAVKLVDDKCGIYGSHMDGEDDKRRERNIRYNWPETGELDVAVKSPNLATIRFTPSEDAIKTDSEEDEHMKKIREHMRAFLAKMKELEAQGYYSEGWDSQTDKTVIGKGGEIVGYMDRDLNIEWR